MARNKEELRAVSARVESWSDGAPMYGNIQKQDAVRPFVNFAHSITRDNIDICSQPPKASTDHGVADEGELSSGDSASAISEEDAGLQVHG